MTELVDEADKLELQKTQVVLAAGAAKILGQFLKAACLRPRSFIAALGMAIKLGRYSRRGILRHIIYLGEACVLKSWWQDADINHVHVHFGTNSTTVALLCRILGGPTYSFTVHGPEEFDMVAEIGLPEKIRQAAFVVAISSFGRSQLYRWCDLEQWSKIHVVHCGLDDSFLSHPPTPIPSTLHLACVGRLCEQKGQLLLVEAVAQLVAEGLNLKLLLVGDGPLRGEIEALIAHRHLQSHIEITGWASNAEVRRHILAARAMVLPSFAEGLPVVIMEALALGRPVVTTYVAGIPELVEPGVCGWLVPPGSVESLKRALRELLQAPVEDLEKMGRLGLERVSENHQAKREAEKLSKLFQFALSKY